MTRRDVNEDWVSEAMRRRYGVDPVGVDDPELDHFDGLTHRIVDNRAEFSDHIVRLGEKRLREPASHERLRSCLARLERRVRAERLGAFTFGEAAQVCLGDLVLLEELERSDVPARTVARLGDELADEALDLVGRLVKNLARRLEIMRHKQVDTSDPEVRPLARVVEAEPSLPNLRPDPDRTVLLVLTAGRGTRLRTTIPKALIPVGGRPMIDHIIDAAREGGIEDAAFLLGHRAEVQTEHLERFGRVAVQKAPQGTSHSALAALSSMPAGPGPIVLCYSDTPFLTGDAFRRPIEAFESEGADFVLSTHPADQDDELGRVVRSDDGRVVAVAQSRLGATSSAEADGGVYAMRVAVTTTLGETLNTNPRYEYTLPDVVAALAEAGKVIVSVPGTRDEYFGVNTPSDLVIARLRAELGGAAPEPGTSLAIARALAFFEQYGGLPAQAAAGRHGASGPTVSDYLARARALVGPILDLAVTVPGGAQT